MKRRSRAADRDLAEYILNLPLGTYEIRVEVPGPGFGLAQIKSEGGAFMKTRAGYDLTVIPHR